MRRLKLLGIGLLLTLACVVGASLAKPHKASAAIWPSPDPWQTIMPYPIFLDLYYCDGGSLSPAYRQWISPQGAPTSSTVTVPYGTTSVNLDLNWNGATCKYSAGSVIDSTLKVVGSTTPGVSGIAGQELYMGFGAGSPVGTYHKTEKTFNFTPPAGSLTPGVHQFVINLDTQSINHFPGSPNFRCIETSANPHTTSGIHDFAPCDVAHPSFLITIVVQQGVTVSGKVVDQDTNVGLPNVTVTYCNAQGGLSTTTTSASGNYSFITGNGSTTCIRVPNSIAGGYANPHVAPRNGNYPPNYTDPTLQFGYRNCPANSTSDPPCNLTSYEYQVAGKNCFNNGANCGSYGSTVLQFDRSIDFGFVFAYKKPAVQVSCTYNSLNPTDPEAGTAFKVNLTLGAKVNGVVNYSATMTGAGLTWGTPIIANGSWTATTGSPGNQRLVTTNNITANNAGVYNATITINYSGAASGSADCAFQVNVYNKPYVRTFDGDSFAGTNCGASTGWPATHTTGGNVDAGGVYGLGDNGAKGSAAQLAMLSLYEIRNFRSSVVRGGPYDRLLFGNSNLPGFSVATGPKGGYLGTPHCPTDYLATMPAADKAVDLAADGVYKVTGSYALPATAGYNNRAVIYVDGDVTIGGDFTYNTGGWTDRNNIPSVTLVANGNIYIGPNVTRLDGTFVAQGKTAGGSPTTKTIYTCSTFTPPAGYVSTDSTYYGACNKQLTVNGSLVAARIKFLRTFGSLRNSTGAGDHPNDVGGGNGTSGSCANAGAVSSPGTCAAEVINFRPETYLAMPAAGSPSTKFNFDYVVSPPPIL